MHCEMRERLIQGFLLKLPAGGVLVRVRWLGKVEAYEEGFRTGFATAVAIQLANSPDLAASSPASLKPVA